MGKSPSQYFESCLIEALRNASHSHPISENGGSPSDSQQLLCPVFTAFYYIARHFVELLSVQALLVGCNVRRITDALSNDNTCLLLSAYPPPASIQECDNWHYHQCDLHDTHHSYISGSICGCLNPYTTQHMFWNWSRIYWHRSCFRTRWAIIHPLNPFPSLRVVRIELPTTDSDASLLHLSSNMVASAPNMFTDIWCVEGEVCTNGMGKPPRFYFIFLPI